MRDRDGAEPTPTPRTQRSGSGAAACLSALSLGSSGLGRGGKSPRAPSERPGTRARRPVPRGDAWSVSVLASGGGGVFTAAGLAGRRPPAGRGASGLETGGAGAGTAPRVPVLPGPGVLGTRLELGPATPPQLAVSPASYGHARGVFQNVRWGWPRRAGVVRSRPNRRHPVWDGGGRFRGSGSGSVPLGFTGRPPLMSRKGQFQNSGFGICVLVSFHLSFLCISVRAACVRLAF